MSAKKFMFCMTMMLALTSACKEEENTESKAPANAIIYDGNEFLIEEAGIKYLKQQTEFPDHYFSSFYFTDGKLTPNEYTEGVAFIEDWTFLLSLTLYSPGTEGFKPGKFQFISTYELESSEANALIKDKFFISNGFFSRLFGNDQDQSSMNTVIDGTMVVSGSANAYTIELDLVLNNGKTLKCNYSGSYVMESLDQ